MHTHNTKTANYYTTQNALTYYHYSTLFTHNVTTNMMTITING